jgi:hypothetical protein
LETSEARGFEGGRDGDEGRSAITWYINAVRLRRGCTMSLGYCGKGMGVAFIAIHRRGHSSWDDVKPYIVQDTYWSRGKCEDGEWCLNLKCQMNRADIKHLKQYVEDFEWLRRIHEWLEKIAEELKLEGKSVGMMCRYKRPPITVKPRTEVSRRISMR